MYVLLLNIVSIGSIIYLSRLCFYLVDTARDHELR